VAGGKEDATQLRKRLKRSEAQVRELVATNEQWAVESRENANVVAVLQIQLQDAQEEIHRLGEQRKRPGGETQEAVTARASEVKLHRMAEYSNGGRGSGRERGAEVRASEKNLCEKRFKVVFQYTGFCFLPGTKETVNISCSLPIPHRNPC
jgi:hypothetical protein